MNSDQVLFLTISTCKLEMFAFLPKLILNLKLSIYFSLYKFLEEQLNPASASFYKLAKDCVLRSFRTTIYNCMIIVPST